MSCSSLWISWNWGEPGWTFGRRLSHFSVPGLNFCILCLWCARCFLLMKGLTAGKLNWLVCLFVCLLQSHVVKHVQYAVYCCLVNNILSHRCFRRTWYFGLHLLCLLVVLALPVKSKRRQAKEQQDDLQKDNQTDHNSTDNNCNQKEKTTWGLGRWRAAPSAAETLRRTINYWDLECVESVYLTKNQISPIRQKTQVYILAKTSSSKADSNHTSDMDTRPRWRNGQGVN